MIWAKEPIKIQLKMATLVKGTIAIYFTKPHFYNLKQIGKSRIGCGIIARSAGILENVKKVCFCSGRTLWEEKAFLTSNHTSEIDHTSPKLMT